MKKQVIYLFFGGKSPEHEISFLTAKLILDHLEIDKYSIYPIYLDKKNTFYYIPKFNTFEKFSDFSSIKKKPLKVIFNKGHATFSGLPTASAALLAFHGGTGENGTMQAFLDLCNIPYTGPSLKSACIAMDKILTKEVLQANNVAVIPGSSFQKETWENDQKDCIDLLYAQISFPMIVKPASLGSSIGVVKVTNEIELIEAIDATFYYDTQVVIEKFIDNCIEVNISVLKSDGVLLTSAMEQVVSKTDHIFSYQDKYQTGKKGKLQSKNNNGYPFTQPAFSSEQKNAIATIAKRAYSILSFESIARIDFFINTKTDEVILIEPNTIPGLLSFHLWEAEGIQFHELLTILIHEAQLRFENEKKYITSFNSFLWNK